MRLLNSAAGSRHFKIKISSTIPLASGLGSGAAVSVAVLRAVSTFAGNPFTNETVNRLAYEVEKLYHGTPSGIDNTVITYAQPVYFIKGQAPLPLHAGGNFTFVIADTGASSPTDRAVALVRRNWEQDTARFEQLFDETGRIVETARQAIESGTQDLLGDSMNKNHSLLQQFGVSTPALDQLVDAARQAGALGAKLSGAGLGGSMIALVSQESQEHISAALHSAGAVRTLVSTIQPTH